MQSASSYTDERDQNAELYKLINERMLRGLQVSSGKNRKQSHWIQILIIHERRSNETFENCHSKVVSNLTFLIPKYSLLKMHSREKKTSWKFKIVTKLCSWTAGITLRWRGKFATNPILSVVGLSGSQGSLAERYFQTLRLATSEVPQGLRNCFLQSPQRSNMLLCKTLMTQKYS